MEPEFKVSFDYESEYIYVGRRYRARLGASLCITSQKYLSEIISQIGTIRHDAYGLSDSYEFPSERVVKIFSDRFGIKMIGAKYSEDMKTLLYNGEHPRLVHRNGIIYYEPWYVYTGGGIEEKKNV